MPQGEGHLHRVPARRGHLPRPFTHIVDINEDIDMLVPGIAKMCSMQHALEEVQYKAISAMVLKLWREYGNELRITGLQRRLQGRNHRGTGRGGRPAHQGPSPSCSTLRQGRAVRALLRGQEQRRFSNDFIVIENEELKRRPDLHAVVNILLLHRITGEMYLTRNRRKVLFVDELKQQLGDIGADDPVKAAVIEEAARRARKYGGALGTATRAPTTTTARRRWKRPSTAPDWVFLLRQKPESIEMLDRKGPAHHGRAEEAAVELATHRGRRVLRGGTSPPRWAKASPATSSIRPPTCCSPTSWKTTRRSTNCAPRGLSIDEAIGELLRRRGHAV